MCIKIIGAQEIEFNPSQPLECQILNAKEIVVSYDPIDPKIDSFVNEMEKIVKNGISCQLNIKVNTNNNLNGLKLQRKIEKLKLQIDINEAVKKITTFHSEADRKMREISEMCVIGKINE